MKTRFFLFLALSLAAFGVSAASLHVVKVNAPAYNCLFSTNCIIVVNDTVAPFTTNLPPFTAGTNGGSVSGFLQSRTFAGLPGTPEAGLYGYEYRLVLNKLVGASSVTIRSMTVNFSPYSSFNYQNQMNKQVWVVTSGGLGSTGPGSATVSGTKVTFRFNPPLVLSGANGPEVSSYFFGMVSSTQPPAMANGLATFTGTVKPTANSAAIPFNYLDLLVRTP